jgi:hypothetical protein
MDRSTFLRAVGPVALDATGHAVWVAAAELSPARRRLVRAGVASVPALVLLRRSSEIKAIIGDRHPLPPSDGDGPAAPQAIRKDTEHHDARRISSPRPGEQGSLGRRVAPVAAVSLVTAATYVVRVRLRRRWLRRLSDQGKAHPHRALAVRVAAIRVAIGLSLRLSLPRIAAWIRRARPDA